MNIDQIQKRTLSFNRRWKIPEDKIDDEKEFSNLKVRINNLMEYIDGWLSDESVTVFCNLYAISEHWEHDSFGGNRWSRNVINALMGTNNIIELYEMLERLSDLKFTTASHRESYYVKVIQAIELSRLSSRVVINKNDELIIQPKGEKLLDTELVDNAISFLGTKSSLHFTNSLRLYQLTGKQNLIKSADETRRAVEEYLKEKLENKKGLKENIIELQKKLKVEKKDGNIRNIIYQCISYLDNYYNNNSKHNDGELEDTEVEYLIYQTATIMRYLENAIK